MNLISEHIATGRPDKAEVKQYFCQYFYQNDLIGLDNFTALHGKAYNIESPSQAYALMLVGAVYDLNNLPYPNTPLYCDADETWETVCELFVDSHLDPDEDFKHKQAAPAAGYKVEGMEQ